MNSVAYCTPESEKLTGDTPGKTIDDSLHLARVLMNAQPVAMGLQGCFRMTNQLNGGPRSVLLPAAEVVEKLELARAAAKAYGPHLLIFACTNARGAVAVKTDSDALDRKYLSGAKTEDGHFAYCGGLNSAIERGLLYARHADVVCLMSENADLQQARKFANEIRASFPHKILGFGHAPKPEATAWNEADHASFEQELQALGYDYYFVRQFGSTVFPGSPAMYAMDSWVLFDDADPVSNVSETDNTSRRFHSRRLPAVRAAFTSRRAWAKPESCIRHDAFRPVPGAL
jgi:hypothetical protein